MNSTLLRSAVAALAAAVLVPAAAAATTAPKPKDFVQRYPVPAGQVQHTVTDNLQMRSGVPKLHNRIEEWTATAASRTTVTNVITGRIAYECGSAGKAWNCFFPDEKVLEQGNGDDALVNASWRDQAAFWGVYDDLKGWAKVGPTVDIGRPATVYRQSSKVENDGKLQPITQTIDVDDEIGFILRSDITSTFPDGSTLEAVTTVTTMETLPAAPVALGLVPHPGAKITKKPKTKATKKPKAKHKHKAKAKKKHKATKKAPQR